MRSPAKCLIYFLAFWCSFAFGNNSLNTDTSMTLEDLLNKRLTIKEVHSAGLKVQDLVGAYIDRNDLTPADKKKYLAKNRIQISKLRVLEKTFLRAKKRERTVKRYPNKHFFGDVDRAENGTLDQLESYGIVREHLDELHNDGSLSDVNYQDCLTNIESLYFLHAHNREISLELSLSPHSATYGERPTLHYINDGTPFQAKADILHDILIKAFIFAKSHGLLTEMFRDALAKGTGCLEARFGKVARWHKNLAQHFHAMKNFSAEEAATILPLSAQEAVNACMEENQDILADVNHETKWHYIAQICESFKGKIGKDRRAITPRLVLESFESVLLMTPETSPSHTPERSPSPTSKRN